MNKIFILLLLIFLSSSTGLFISKAEAKNEKLKVEFVKGEIIIYSANKKLVEVKSINFNFTPPKSIAGIKVSGNEILFKSVYPATAKYGGAESD